MAEGIIMAKVSSNNDGAIEREAARQLRALLVAVGDETLVADSSHARRLRRRIEGAVVAFEATLVSRD